MATPKVGDSATGAQSKRPQNAQKGQKGFIEIPVEDRFWSKVDRNGANGCWVWTGASTMMGYGQFWMNRRLRKATHVAWELLRGECEPGKMLCHICDNPPCVNPDHLFWGTMSDNILDAYQKGKYKPTEATPHQIGFLKAIYDCQRENGYFTTNRIISRQMTMRLVKKELVECVGLVTELNTARRGNQHGKLRDGFRLTDKGIESIRAALAAYGEQP